MPDDPNPIDISLALTQVGAVFDSFVAELKDIRTSMEAMNATTTAETLAANQKMAAPQSTPSKPPEADAPPSGPSSKASRGMRRVFAGNRELSAAALDVIEKNEGQTPSPVALLKDSTLSFRDALTMTRQGYGMQGADAVGGLAAKYKQDWNNANLFEKYYVAQSLTQHVTRGFRSMASHNPMNLGSELGYSQEGAGGGIWQMPWAPVTTEAGRKGISEWFKRKNLAWGTPGLDTKDVGEIQGALYQQGYVEGGARDRMMDAMISVKKRYKGMDTNLMASMLDQGTRYGTGTVDDMVGIMKKIPDAARAARLGMNEMVSAITEVANASQKQGATFKQGAAFGYQALVTTGRDPRLAQQLSENSFVQARIMAQTGVLPQAQGALDVNQRLNLGNRSLRDQYNIYRGMRPLPVKDPLTGEAHVISGEAQALAMTANATGLSVDVVRSQLKDERRQTMLNNLITHTRFSSQDVAAAAGRHDWKGARAELLDTSQLDKMQRQGVIKDKDGAINDIWSDAAKAVLEADKETDPGERATKLKAAATEKLNRLNTLAKESTKAQIGKSAGKQRVDVNISLTKRAADLFKAVTKSSAVEEAKDIAQAGGEPVLQGIAPTLSKLATNSGLLGFGD